MKTNLRLCYNDPVFFIWIISIPITVKHILRIIDFYYLDTYKNIIHMKTIIINYYWYLFLLLFIYLDVYGGSINHYPPICNYDRNGNSLL